MIIVNEHNYEAYYLDYLEGNLNKEDTAQLLKFLDKNPLLKLELDDIDDVVLEADTLVSFNKNLLKKNIDSTSVEDYIIASLENEISEDDAKELEDFLKNDADAKLLSERYEKTILPKEHIIYPRKSDLKKRRTIPFYAYPMAGAAAVIILFILLQIPRNNDPVLNNSIIVSNNGNSNSEKNLKTQILPKEISETKEELQFEKTTKRQDEDILNIKHVDILEKKDQETFAINESVAEDTNSKEPVLLSEEEVISSNENTLDLLNDDFGKDSIAIASATSPEAVHMETKKQPSASKDPTLIELAIHTIKKKLINKEIKSDQEISGSEIVGAFVEKIDKASDKNIVYRYNKNTNSTSVQFAIGKFEFYRSKNN